MSFSIFKNSKDPEAAMSLVAHLLSPEETLGVMKDSYGQFAPVLDKGRLASKDYFSKIPGFEAPNFEKPAPAEEEKPESEGWVPPSKGKPEAPLSEAEKYFQKIIPNK